MKAQGGSNHFNKVSGMRVHGFPRPRAACEGAVGSDFSSWPAAPFYLPTIYRMDTMKKTKLELADSDDDIIGCEYCICAPAKDGKPLIFPDNVMDFCVVCGCKVQLRPNVPPGPKRICYGCAQAQM